MIEVVFCETTKQNLIRAKRNIAKSRGDILRETTDKVVVISLQMDQGKISDNGLGDERLAFLKQKKDCFLFGEELNFGQEHFDESIQSINTIKSALQNDEIVRIWYGQNSEEFCGFCWLTSLIRSWNIINRKILYVKLPKYVFSYDGEYKKCCGSGSFNVDELSRYSIVLEILSDSISRFYSDVWNRALAENSQLRVLMNGILLSVDEEFFDSVILREASKLDIIFDGITLVGNLVKYIGIDFVFWGKRIDKLISLGNFSIVKESERCTPFYMKKLKRNYD